MLAVTDVIRKVQDLPSLPAVVSELMHAMGREDVDLNQLAGKIALDQSLAAKTLRLANSSFYGLPSRVTSMQQAAAVLGLHSIRTLVTACSITGSFPPMAGTPHFNFTAFWRHSIATAVCARALAPHLRVHPDTAFTAGLLHDLGTLVLATRYPDEYAVMEELRRNRDCCLCEAETVVFGFEHAQVGSALAAWWKFPQEMQQAVASHHAAATCTAAPLALAVHLANTIAHGLGLSGVDDEQAPPVLHQAWRAAALSDETYLQVFRETEQHFGDLCQVLLTS